MFTFLWKHKLLSLLLACAIAYFFVNPAGKFGLAWKNFVVFNRVPVSFLDCYVAPDKSIKMVENLANKETLADIFSDLSRKPVEDKVLLIVGTGFSGNSYQLSDSITLSLEAKGITLTQLPSREAIRLYNSAGDTTKVAILLRLRK
jgi:hypothetical protein